MSERGAPAAPPELILAFDYGSRRIGVASGETLTRTARALTTLQRTTGVPWDAIDALVREYQPLRLVVGLPLNMDGTPTALTDDCRAFAAQLKARYARPTVLVDERLSSREAEAALRQARALGLKRRRTAHADVDKVAARIVLERWLENPEAAHEL
ncbi:MAG TPA: Holliday junction resolvase RuvX [Steroidobacter sp.]|jgi:putative Holliday junction resolvase|nr:Holliday junction resolvase RuvX [Steroidobacteraceae bacterium]HLS82179.1 Holliday junction resolvase RuvX [Steroidobacter sp.]